MRRKYRNIAFLAELLVNILVFSVSCAVLVGLFGKAGQLSRQTREKAGAGAQVLAVVETVKARGAAGLENAVQTGDDEWTMYYDAGWNPVAENGAYAVVLRLTGEAQPAGVLNHVQVVATGSDGQEIYRVETANYQPGAGGEAA